MKYLEEDNADELSTISGKTTNNGGLGDIFKKMLDTIDNFLTNDE
jgi:hypothetical protein